MHKHDQQINAWDILCTFSIMFCTLDSPNDICVIILYAGHDTWLALSYARYAACEPINGCAMDKLSCTDGSTSKCSECNTGFFLDETETCQRKLFY